MIFEKLHVLDLGVVHQFCDLCNTVLLNISSLHLSRVMEIANIRFRASSPATRLAQNHFIWLCMFQIMIISCTRFFAADNVSGKQDFHDSFIPCNRNGTSQYTAVHICALQVTAVLEASTHRYFADNWPRPPKQCCRLKVWLSSI